jgi:hypothetical protein
MSQYLEAMQSKKQSTPQNKSTAKAAALPVESDSDVENNDMNGVNIHEDEIKKHLKPKTDNKKSIILLQSHLANDESDDDASDDDDVMNFDNGDDEPVAKPPSPVKPKASSSKQPLTKKQQIQRGGLANKAARTRTLTLTPKKVALAVSTTDDDDNMANGTKSPPFVGKRKKAAEAASDAAEAAADEKKEESAPAVKRPATKGGPKIPNYVTTPDAVLDMIDHGKDNIDYKQNLYRSLAHVMWKKQFGDVDAMKQLQEFKVEFEQCKDDIKEIKTMLQANKI